MSQKAQRWAFAFMHCLLCFGLLFSGLPAMPEADVQETKQGHA